MKVLAKIGKGIFIFFGVVVGSIILLFVACAVIMSKGNKEYESNRIEMNSVDGLKKAYIIYQPAALSDAVEKVSNGIADGLVEQGYSVSIDYCGKHISDDLTDYDVIVYGGPTYAGHTSSVLLNTVERVSDYREDQKLIVFSVGMMDTQTEIDEIVEKVNGSVRLTKKFKASDTDITQQAKDWVIQF